MAEATSLGRTSSSARRFGAGKAPYDGFKPTLKTSSVLTMRAEPQDFISAGAKEVTQKEEKTKRDTHDLKIPTPTKCTHVQEATRLALVQARNSLIFFAVVGTTALLNSPRSSAGQFARKFYILQDVDANGLAGTHWADALFTTSCLFLIVLARALVTLLSMHVLGPFLGIKNDGKPQVRFAEQTWSFLYYGGLFVVGMVLLRNSEYTWYNAEQLWDNFPHVRIPALIKAYYLNATGYWISQLYIIHVEERRRDHYQMFLHHIVTVLLTAGSYVNNYTRIGHIILVLMDFVDALLSFAKMLKYLGMTRLCDVAFMVFLVGWITLRHGLYIYHMKYAFYEVPRRLAAQAAACGEGDVWFSSCYSEGKHKTFVWLLFLLQLITLAWLYFILRIVARVIRGEPAEDNRSDESDDDE